jgi:hypothetical protein
MPQPTVQQWIESGETQTQEFKTSFFESKSLTTTSPSSAPAPFMVG